ncbi:hypothetical protein [Streptomyces sp. NPDC060198]|uniref:hypothetical protein n=1 Tax=Streptomyces sp. NPDC060198 TaxID=3347070 RepID=UPI0036699AFA
MDTDQRVIRRNGLLSRLTTALVIVSAGLLIYGVWRENAPPGLADHWPWKLRLLDIQSASTALVGSLGASLARAQYARAVRPALGHFGRVTDGLAPEGRLAWTCHVVNGSQDVAVVESLTYRMWLRGPTPPAGAREWVNHAETLRALGAYGLSHRADFSLPSVGRGKPLLAQSPAPVGWFTEAALAVITEMHVRLRVTDRVGDTHERVMNLLRDVERIPERADPPLF